MINNDNQLYKGNKKPAVGQTPGAGKPADYGSITIDEAAKSAADNQLEVQKSADGQTSELGKPADYCSITINEAVKSSADEKLGKQKLASDQAPSAYPGAKPNIK